MTGDVATVDTLTALSRLIGRVVRGRKHNTQPAEITDMRTYTLTFRAMADDRLTVILDVEANRASEAIRWGRDELIERFGADNAAMLYLSDYSRTGHRSPYRSLTGEDVAADEQRAAAAARAHRDSPEVRAAIAEAVQHRHNGDGSVTMTAGISTPERASSPDWGPSPGTPWPHGQRPEHVAPAAWGIR